MNKITIEYKNQINKQIVPMKDMPFGSIGIIVEGTYKDTIIRRTNSEEFFVVEDLSNPRQGRCWDRPNDLRVELLRSAEIKVII